MLIKPCPLGVVTIKGEYNNNNRSYNIYNGRARRGNIIKVRKRPKMTGFHTHCPFPPPLPTTHTHTTHYPYCPYCPHCPLCPACACPHMPGVGARAPLAGRARVQIAFVLPTPGVIARPYGHPTGISVREGKPPTHPRTISKFQKD